MNLKRMLLLLALSAAISAVAGPQKVKTSVEKVTLFIDGAQVTRTRQVDLPAGNSTVVFTGLSPYLDDKSMQVSAKGPFTVTAVNRLFNHTDSLERSTRQKTLEGDGKEAITRYRLLHSNGAYSLLELDLETGRKNQIRAQMQSIGHSIAGDYKYGAETDPTGRLMLHARRLNFIHPVTGEEMHFETRIPDKFTSLAK